MRKLWAWSGVAILVGGLVATSGRAGDDDSGTEEAKPAPKPASSFRWSPTFARMFKIDDKPAPKKTDEKSKKDTAKKTVSAKAATVVEEATSERARDEANLLRRLQVCDRLKEIGQKTNDNELIRLAETLDERARTAYSQRTAYLKGTGGKFESDEKTLDSYLGARTAAPMKSTDLHTVSGNDTGSRAAIKEVNP